MEFGIQETGILIRISDSTRAERDDSVATGDVCIVTKSPTLCSATSLRVRLERFAFRVDSPNRS